MLLTAKIVQMRSNTTRHYKESADAYNPRLSKVWSHDCHMDEANVQTAALLRATDLTLPRSCSNVLQQCVSAQALNQSQCDSHYIHYKAMTFV